jgi:hypothetical protein
MGVSDWGNKGSVIKGDVDVAMNLPEGGVLYLGHKKKDIFI